MNAAKRVCQEHRDIVTSNLMRIGIDIGGTNLRIGSVNDDGTVIHKIETPTPASDPPEATIQAIINAIGELGKPTRVGIGAPGLIDSKKGIVRISPNLPQWENVPLADTLEKELGVHVKLANDVNAIAWGEFLFGAGRGCRDILVMTLGTGLGGALILDGNLHLGKDETAGEIGHVTLIPDGYPCPCGNRGCLEQYVAKNGIVRRALTIKKDLVDPTPESIARAAAKGEQWALSVFEGVGINLGQIVAGMIQVLNLEKVIIGGKIAEAGEVLFGPLRVHTAERIYPLLRESFSIEKVALGHDSGIIGAAFL